MSNSGRQMSEAYPKIHKSWERGQCLTKASWVGSQKAWTERLSFAEKLGIKGIFEMNIFNFEGKHVIF